MTSNIEELYDNMHKYHLEIMLEIKRICDKNNIDYYLIGGTLLGAIRHKGFIPWDDDADIGMLRDDYNKFILICKEQLNSKFRLDVCFEDPENFITFIKIKYKGIKFVEDSNKQLNVNHELFIDIFPIDKISNDLKTRKRQKIKLDWYKFLIYGKYNVPSNSKVKGVIKRTIAHIYPVNKVKLKEKYISISSKVTEIDCQECRVFGSSYEYSKEIIPLKDLKQKVIIDFEGVNFYTFLNYEIYLERVYGDYMSLPSVDKRYGTKHKVLIFNDDEYMGE